MWICKNCNGTTFYARYIVSEIQIINSNEDWIKTIDSDVDDGPFDVECKGCGLSATWVDDNPSFVDEIQEAVIKKQKAPVELPYNSPFEIEA